MILIPRREFLISIAAAAAAAACRKPSAKLGPLLAPSELARRMNDVDSGKIVVLFVGFASMFQLGHVPGARDLGPASEPEGRAALEQALRSLPPDVEAFLYCGCCPVADCPNVHPASEVIAALARPDTYLLDLPTRFSTDWIDHGYPVEPRATGR
jgi:hypothetical protein